MCQDQRIPSNARMERLKSILEAAGEATGEAQDIFALDRGVIGSNDQAVESMNHIVNNLDVDNLEHNLLNRGRIQMQYTLPCDYENIFNMPGLSRRSARPVFTGLNIKAEWFLLIEDWVEMCLDDPWKTVDWQLPDDITCFEQIMERGMPAKLDLNSWIGKVVRNILDENLPFDSLSAGKFCEWEPGMGTNRVRYQDHDDGTRAGTVAFLGEAKPGCLVWGPALSKNFPFLLVRGYVREIGKTIRNAEAALIALARRIAGHVARSIVYQYAMPQAVERGYGILTRQEIGRAVKEILGDEWFDLPFDDGSLRDWSEDDVLKPDEEMMDGEDVFIEQMW